MAGPEQIRCGVVGAGRTRQGTGPFLARFLEQGGARVTGIAGRDGSRTESAAADLAGEFGHQVVAHSSVEDLLASGLDALVIASPDATHAAAMAAALDARVACLCEKPLVPAEDAAAVLPLLEGFRNRGLLLMEACQWPEVLPALAPFRRELAPVPRQLAMRLSPAEPGPGTLRGSLSHLLSLAQSCWPVDATTIVRELCFTGETRGATGLEVHFRLQNPPSERGLVPDLHCRLELLVCPEQPRPAWIEFDGRRMVRKIELSTYRMRFVSGGGSISIDDPTAALVYRFLELVRTPNIERTRAESESIAQRARLYAEIVHAFQARLD